MEITFFSAAGCSFTKHFGANGNVQPYPHVKKMSSHVETISSIEELHESLVSNGNKGHCLLKGNLKDGVVLSEESRANKTDRFAYTQLLVLDIDGLPLDSFKNIKTFNRTKIKALAEQIVSTMPEALHNVSYIVQASASLGLKKGKVSLHIFMLLDIPIPPKSIKLWLKYVNLESDLLREQATLSVNGTSLCYILDPSVADNSKVIFIAPPTFEDPKQNPFKNNDDRIVLVKKQSSSFDLAELFGTLNAQQLQELESETKKELRKSLNIKTNKKDKFQSLTIKDETYEVLQNPNRMSINPYSMNEELGIVHCNINNGDSHAYWFWLRDPEFMMNFKDEPIWRIADADPEFANSIPDLFDDHIAALGQVQKAVFVRDYFSDTYYNGVFDPDAGQFTHDYPLVPTSKQAEESFMKTQGRVTQDFVPDAKIIFDPTNKNTTDLTTIGKYVINMYQESDYITNANLEMPELSLGTAIEIKEHCPTIYKLIFHMLGEGNEEFERFINWLAYIYQCKEKTQVAWVLTGIQGTGKGLFYQRVLKPLFGDSQCPMRTLESMEEKFNRYMRNALFLVLDEFHMASSREKKLEDKLKNLITEPTLSLRAMHSDSKEIKSYTNFIILSNKYDPVKMPLNDRRYSIAPRQEIKILDAYPEIIDELSSNQHELLNFSGCLAKFKYDENIAKTAFQNTAKEKMRNLAMDNLEFFANQVAIGQLNYFLDILDMNTGNTFNANEIQTAQRLVKQWVMDSQHIKSDESFYSLIKLEELRTIYHVLLEPNNRFSAVEFKQAMQRLGLETQRKRPYAPEGQKSKSNAQHALVVQWQLEVETFENVVNNFDAVDKKAFLSAA